MKKILILDRSDTLSLDVEVKIIFFKLSTRDRILRPKER